MGKIKQARVALPAAAKATTDVVLPRSMARVPEAEF